MARSVLEIILSLKGDKATRELKKVDKELGKVEKSAKKSSVGFKGVSTQMLAMGAAAGGAIFAAVKLGKALWDMGKQGAIVEQTTESFDFLIEKLELAPDILEQLQEASRGTVDDMTLMSGTATLLAGTSDKLGKAMGDATPKLMEIAKAANKLNPALGDTAFMYQSIATGVKRAQPLILDNLGLTLKVGDANETMAKSLGKTVEALTADEKAMAILNATLEAGDTMLDQVGGNVDSSTDSFARMETKVTNLKNELMVGLSPAIIDTVDEINPLVQGISDWIKTESILKKALEKGIITKAEHTEKTRELLLFSLDLAEAEEYLAEKTEEYTEEMGIGTDATIGWADAVDTMMIPAIEEAIDETELLKIEQQELKDSLDDLRLFIRGPVGDELDNFIEKQGDLQQETNDLEAEIKELTDLPYLSKEQKEQLDKLQTELGEVNKAIDENTKAHDEAQKRIVFDLLTQQAAADGLTETEVKGLTYVAEKFGIIDEETARVTEEIAGHLKQLEEDESIYKFGENVTETVEGIGEDTDEVMEYFSEWQEAIAELEGVHPIEFVITATGDIPQRGALPREHTGLNKPYYEEYPKGAGGGGPGAQHGLNMVVPPGFPNDSYPIWTTSGEHVQITPRGQQVGATSYTQNVTQHFHSEGAAALGMAILRKYGRDRLNSSMGR